MEEEMKRFEAEISSSVKNQFSSSNFHVQNPVTLPAQQRFTQQKYLGSTFPGSLLPTSKQLQISAAPSTIKPKGSINILHIRPPPPPPPSLLKNNLQLKSFPPIPPPAAFHNNLQRKALSNLETCLAPKSLPTNAIYGSSPATIYAAPTTNNCNTFDDSEILSILQKTEKVVKKEIKEEKKLKVTSSISFTPSSVSATISGKLKNEDTEKEKPIVNNTKQKVHVGQKTKKAVSSKISKAETETPMATFSGNLPGAVPSYDGIKAPAHATINDETVKKIKKSKKIVRTGGGQMWEDPSLKEWDVNDFRIFCGDLGNDVTDEVLQRTFGRYPSFQKAKVIRDKKSNKTKGFGFVSFRDPADFTKAMREMNGKYVGSRPIKMRKSNWKDRNIEIVKQKQKTKQQMGYKW